MKVLNSLMNKTKELQLLKGIFVGSGGNSIEISHFFFADDTLIYCQTEKTNFLHLRCTLLCFQAIFGLYINLNKSEMVRI